MAVKPALAVALAVLALTGCTGAGDPQPSASGSAVSPSGSAVSPSASPEPAVASPGGPSPSAAASSSPTPQLVATIPTDCRALVPAAKYDAVFGTTPLNDPGFVDPAYAGQVEPVESVPGSNAQSVLYDATRLRCIWHDPAADVTQITVEVAQVDPAVADVHFDDREIAGGFTCGTEHGGRLCQLVRQNDYYPVEEATTIFLRDDVYVSVFQADFPTDDLMGDIVASIWR